MKVGEDTLREDCQFLLCVCLPQKQFKANTSDFQSLQKVIEGDPLSQLDEQDKELIWKARLVNTCAIYLFLVL